MRIPVNEDQGIALLKRIAGKDRKAFEEFYFLYSGGLGAFLLKMLRQDDWVDEAVNELMFTVWQSAERFDPARGRLSTWLFGIAHNKGLQILEKNNRYREESLEDQTEGLYTEEEENSASDAIDSTSNSEPERILGGWQLGDAMSWAFMKLSADHRAVIDLCFIHDLSYQEIADVVGCPVNTVKTRLFHARKRLAELLTSKGFSLSSV